MERVRSRCHQRRARRVLLCRNGQRSRYPLSAPDILFPDVRRRIFDVCANGTLQGCADTDWQDSSARRLAPEARLMHVRASVA